jgi:hypothetical protein
MPFLAAVLSAFLAAVCSFKLVHGGLLSSTFHGRLATNKF